MSNYDFSGWATRNNLKCSDGRTILKDAFKHNDGCTVPLVWNHQHNDPLNVLGHALLENRDEGVYAYCTFNDTDAGKNAKMLVEHGDISALSIYANQLRQQGGNVLHGAIREVSLVLAGANPGAFIDSIISHSDVNDGMEEAIIYTGENLEIFHAEEENKEGEEKMSEVNTLTHAEESEETVQDVFNTLNEKQKTVVYALIGQALEDAKANEEGDDNQMKHNVFDQNTVNNSNVLSHSDQMEIIETAKNSNVGSFQRALKMYADDNALQHGFVNADGEEAIGELFPEYDLVKKGAPETIENDHEWVNVVMSKVHRSPISRIRTRQADARSADLRAKGYKKGSEKSYIGNIKLLNRTTDPQTIYVKDKLERDDIIDITDFDVVNYMYGVMKNKMNEELAMAFMVGDQREEGEADKISETHVRSIWNDDELYTIHVDVDYEAAKNELQGSNTSVNFGDNYIKAEATVTAALYAREQLKGKSNLDFFCTPHQLNVMLLARDLNGRRIYDSKSDLAKALNVDNIYTAEQLEGLTRTTAYGKTKKLLGLFVNLSQYHVGATKGGQLTKFEQFDIDFNQYKYLLETRLSGASVAIKSAIALEEDVTDAE